MAWVYLLIAAIFEICWAIGLKYSDGFTNFWPSFLTVVAMVISLVFLSLSVRSIPLGTAYAVWTGVGILGTAILGVTLFAEPLNAWRMVFLCLVLTGLVGLKTTS